MKMKEYLEEDYLMKEAAEEMGFDYEENERLLEEADRLEKSVIEALSGEVAENGNLP
jgi:hypothetical protein